MHDFSINNVFHSIGIITFVTDASDRGLLSIINCTNIPHAAESIQCKVLHIGLQCSNLILTKPVSLTKLRGSAILVFSVIIDIEPFLIDIITGLKKVDQIHN